MNRKGAGTNLFALLYFSVCLCGLCGSRFALNLRRLRLRPVRKSESKRNWNQSQNLLPQRKQGFTEEDTEAGWTGRSMLPQCLLG
jgi:hypothetical protein